MRFVSWKKKSYQEHPSFLLRPPPHRSLIHSFVYSFIGFTFTSLLCRSVWFMFPRLASRRSHVGEGLFLFFFLAFCLSSTVLLESPIPWFIPSGPLSSLVECLTLQCVWGIGRSGHRELWHDGSGDTWQGQRMGGKRLTRGEETVKHRQGQSEPNRTKQTDRGDGVNSAVNYWVWLS